MAIAQKEELLKYIKAAIELETDVVMQTNLINTYQEEMKTRYPVLKHQFFPEKPEPQYSTDDGSKFFVPLLLGGFALLSAFIAYVSGPTLRGVALLSLIIGCALLFFAYCHHRSGEKANQEMYNTYYLPALKKYEEKCEQIKQENQANAIRHAEEMVKWQKDHDNSMREMTQYTDETIAVLENLYTKDEIYPKYRNLPALTSIYEYLVTGRCEELAGPHGAYNMYEDEVRKDTVISQLNTVIENLEQIRQNQYMLYQQVTAIQKNTSAIASELRQIKGYTVQIAQLTALNTYYAGLTERNTRITMYYHL